MIYIEELNFESFIIGFSWWGSGSSSIYLNTLSFVLTKETELSRARVCTLRLSLSWSHMYKEVVLAVLHCVDQWDDSFH